MGFPVQKSTKNARERKEKDFITDKLRALIVKKIAATYFGIFKWISNDDISNLGRRVLYIKFIAKLRVRHRNIAAEIAKCTPKIYVDTFFFRTPHST